MLDRVRPHKGNTGLLTSDHTSATIYDGKGNIFCAWRHFGIEMITKVKQLRNNCLRLRHVVCRCASC